MRSLWVLSFLPFELKAWRKLLEYHKYQILTSFHNETICWFFIGLMFMFILSLYQYELNLQKNEDESSKVRMWSTDTIEKTNGHEIRTVHPQSLLLAFSSGRKAVMLRIHIIIIIGRPIKKKYIGLPFHTYSKIDYYYHHLKVFQSFSPDRHWEKLNVKDKHVHWYHAPPIRINSRTTGK